MSWVTPALVIAAVLAGALGWWYPLRDPGVAGAVPGRQPWRVALVVGLVGTELAALLTAALWPPQGLAGGVLVVAAVLSAACGGGPVTTAVLRAAEGAVRTPAGGTPLKGGRMIGILERSLVCVSVVAGWPEGIAIVMAIKALGRYPELRQGEGTSERFIVGTLASVLWAVTCSGPVLIGG